MNTQPNHTEQMQDAQDNIDAMKAKIDENIKLTAKTLYQTQPNPIDEEIRIALGEVSALFMSQECEGTEIIMPMEDLLRISDNLSKSVTSLLAEKERDVLKKFILEYQSAELDGKKYDFYFAIRTRLDEITPTTK